MFPRGAASVAFAASVAAGMLTGCSASVPVEEYDCINDPASGKVRSVSCDKPHYGEVVAIYVALDGAYPGEDALTQAAEEKCRAGFTAYVGKPVESSEHDLVPLLPSEEAWEELGDREVLCVARRADGAEIEGTLRLEEE